MLTGEDYLSGQIILINKPLHWTSFQAVKKVKYGLQRKYGLKKIKIGHAGTLDPLASGLLIMCSGKYTKKIESIQSQPKKYQGIITLGATTPSYDLETDIDQTFPLEHISPKMIEDARHQFIGDISQVPPKFSALKKNGRRLYEYARENQQVEISSRKIHITDFDIIKIDMPQIHFQVLCSKGTYIRSLAHDFGKALSSGAHLSELSRTQIGDYSLENAISPESFLESLL